MKSRLDESRLLDPTPAVHYGPQWNMYAEEDYSVRAIASDVDNTQVGDNSPESQTPDMLQAIERGTRMQVHFHNVSTRGLSKLLDTMIDPVIEAVGDDGRDYVRYHSMSNGGQIYDAVERKFVHEAVIPQDATRVIAQQLQRWGVRHWVQDGGVDHIWQGGTIALGRGDSLGTYLRPRNLWLPNEPNNLSLVESYVPKTPLIIVAEGVDDEQFDEIEDLADEFAEDGVTILPYDSVTHANGPSLHKVFILPEISNKRYALGILSELTKVALDETMFIGDGQNDEDGERAVLEVGGISAAVGNAKPNILDLAVLVGPHQRDEGAAKLVATALQNYGSIA